MSETSETQQGEPQILREFESAWESGVVENFVESIPPEARENTDLLTELACIDLENRLKQEQETNVEFYTTQFPQLAHDELVLLELVRTEHAFRSDRESVTAESYCERFPQLRRHIEMMFQLEFNRSGSTHTRDANIDWECASCGTVVECRDADITQCPECRQPVKIGRYELMERVGQGAFGNVYRARDPKLAREVAVKLPRSQTFLLPEETERFLRESRNAAQLDHPGIVRVFDTGRHEGLPYIVSEFVDGQPLSEEMREQSFEFREAAEFVLQVATATAHAHERGVVHRDLKPSNIMTNLRSDGELVLRVMDFGLARRAHTDVTVTMDGQAVGTPAYMSPEQARGDIAQVDERSDIYSLGIILYELICGVVPFRGNVQRLIEQVINDDPTAPSRFRSGIPRDLETICMKAINREASGRYGSVGDFAADLRRWLDGWPIQAKPIGFAGRAVRWMKRHPTITLLSAALTVAIVAGFAGVTSQWLRAEENALLEAQARVEEARARKVAETEAATAQAVTDFVNEMLSVAEIRRKGRRATIVEAVNAGVVRIDDHFNDRPLVEAAVRFTVGKIYRNLGQFEAIEQFRLALELQKTHLGDTHDKTLLTMDRLAGALRALGDEADMQEAMQLREYVVAKKTELQGEDHEDTLLAMNNLALVYDESNEDARALEIYNRVLHLMEGKTDRSEDLELITRHNIGLVFWDMKKLGEAETILRQVAAAHEGLPDFKLNRDYLNTVHCLAAVLADAEKYDESKIRYQQAISGRSELLGPRHRHTMSSRRGLGRMLIKARRLDEAKKVVDATLESHIDEYGPAHENTIAVRLDRFKVLEALGEYREADEFLTESIKVAKKIRGPNSSKAKLMQDALDEFRAAQ